MLLEQTCLNSLKVRVEIWVDSSWAKVRLTIVATSRTMETFPDVLCDDEYVYKRVDGYYIPGSFQWFHEKYFYSILCLFSIWKVALSLHTSIPPPPELSVFLQIKYTALFRQFWLVYLVLLLLVVSFLGSGDYVLCWKPITNTSGPLIFISSLGRAIIFPVLHMVKLGSKRTYTFAYSKYNTDKDLKLCF